MKSNTKQLIEIIGIFGVISSLVFVGMQLMLDRRIAVSEQYSNRSESMKADLRARLESEPYMLMQTKIWEDGKRPPWWSSELETILNDSEFTGSDLMSQTIPHEIQILHWDNLLFQFNQGLLDDEFWSGSSTVLKRDLRDPLARAVYLYGARGLRPVILELIDELDNE